jgi:hypothetical protein
MSADAPDNARHSPQPARESAQPPPPLPNESLATEIADNTTIDENIDFGDDEEAMLEYALTLSRQLAQPTATPVRNSAQSNEIVRSTDIGITIPENRVESHDRGLTSSAMRLIDLIEEALNMPSHHSDHSASSSSSSSGGNQDYGSFSSHSSTDI